MLYKKILPLLFSFIFFFLSCNKKPEYGILSVSMKDSPADYQEVNIDLETLEVLLESKGSSQWYKLSVNKGLYDLLLLQNTSVLLASQITIPTGKICKIRLTLGSNNSIKQNDRYYSLTTLNHSTKKCNIVIAADYIVTAHGILNILIDFDVDKSVIKTANQKFILNPVIISGLVNSPLDIY